MTNNSEKIKTMTITALLCAIGIVIPMYAPGIRLEPASFTLASHVAVFIAMFISPPVAIFVAGVTTFGFFIAGFPIVIVLRALTHMIFASVGAYVLKRNGNILLTVKKSGLFAFLISLLHAISEVIIVSLFYWGSGMTTNWYDKGYLVAVIGLVGLGTLIHSMIDFSIAVIVWKPLQHVISIRANAKIRAH